MVLPEQVPTLDDVPRPTREDGLWADDMRPGQRFTCSEIELTTNAIVNVASQLDPQPFHLMMQRLGPGTSSTGWLPAAGTQRRSRWTSCWTRCRSKPASSGRPGGDVAERGTARGPASSGGDTGRHQLVKQSTEPGVHPGVSPQPDKRGVNQRGEVRQRSSIRLVAWHQSVPPSATT